MRMADVIEAVPRQPMLPQIVEPVVGDLRREEPLTVQSGKDEAGDGPLVPLLLSPLIPQCSLPSESSRWCVGNVHAQHAVLMLDIANLRSAAVLGRCLAAPINRIRFRSRAMFSPLRLPIAGLARTPGLYREWRAQASKTTQFPGTLPIHDQGWLHLSN